jgi:uncharacterized membrane protein SpoIIM required for sporulation
LLTTCEAIVMVSGAVIVSSQTTSTRAANLLASFIIVPMAFLVQVESIIMFQAAYGLLWGFVAALIVVDLLLVRMGAQLFDREELLGREFDTLGLKQRWRAFVRFFKQTDPRRPAEPFTLWRVYRRDLPAIVRRSRNAARTVLIATAIGLIAGWLLALAQPPLAEGGVMSAEAGSLPVRTILANNARAVVLTGAIGIFTFGVLPTVVPLINSGLVAFVVTRVASAGYNPLTLIAAGILPHGVFELTGVWLASILALRLGAVVIARQHPLTLGESWLSALADYLKVLIFVALPLLVIAAFVEANVTPLVLKAALGR